MKNEALQKALQEATVVAICALILSGVLVIALIGFVIFRAAGCNLSALYNNFANYAGIDFLQEDRAMP